MLHYTIAFKFEKLFSQLIQQKFKNFVFIYFQLSSIIIKKQTIGHMEKDMERWLKVRWIGYWMYDKDCRNYLGLMKRISCDLSKQDSLRWDPWTKNSKKNSPKFQKNSPQKKKFC